MAEPPAKRPRTDCAEAASPPPRGSRMLHQTFLAVLFLVRVSVRSTGTVSASLSQIGSMVQAHVDRAFHRYHQMISSKLESFQGQIEDLHSEVRQLARLCSNRFADQETRVEPNQEHAATVGSNTNTRLCFLNALRPPIYTDKNITDENNASIKVAMFEGDRMITSGLLSRVKVEILVLRGDFSNNNRDNWTEEEFDKHIVQGRDGQGLVLRTAWLNNGVVELSHIRFREGSCRTPSRKFIMAARVCKSERTGIRIQEAITKPVTVLDRRNEPNEKRHPPRLADDVYRLEEIARDGVYHKRLQNAKIYKVEGFLKALNEDSIKLRGILKMERQRNSWSKLIEHAKECVFEDRQEIKRYLSEEGNVTIFFNCVHNLVGAAFPRDYVPCEGFEPDQKALVDKWKRHAYNNLEDILPDYVMKGNNPVPISTNTDVAAGPSVLSVDALRPVPSAESLVAYQGNQGTGAVENSLKCEVNHVTPPIYPNANNDPMINCPGYLDLGTVLPGQQPIPPASIVADCQRNPVNLMNHLDAFQCGNIDGSQFSEGWLLGDNNVSAPSSMTGESSCCYFTMGDPQLWYAEHGQEPSCSMFPGSGHSNGC